MSNLPAIPEPSTDPQSLRETIVAMKEVLENMIGLRGAASTTTVTSTGLYTAKEQLVGKVNEASETAAAALLEAVNTHLATYHPDVADQSIIANLSGGADQPSAHTLVEIFNTILGLEQGALYFCGAAGIQKLSPGSAGSVLQTNGAGADPSWAGGWTTIFKSADTDISSNTTLADDAELQFSMLANTNYAIQAKIITSNTAPGGWKVGITGPASPTRIAARQYTSVTISGSDYPLEFNLATTYTTLLSFARTNFSYVWNLEMFIENGANAGTFALQFAQSTSEVTASKFHKGSRLEYRVVA